MSLENKLKFETSLILKNFEKLIAKVNDEEWTGESKFIKQFMFDEKAAQRHYDIFKERVLNSIGKEYLPVYRMADGEFVFCLHKKKSYLKRLINKILLRKPDFRTIWGEEYLVDEFDKAYVIFQHSVKEISLNGILAMHFIKDSYTNISYKAMEWFDKSEIEIQPRNYTSFYFVYALLSSHDRSKVYKDKNILVVTSADANKSTSIINHLKINEFAKSVQVYPISKNRSIFDKIDLTQIVIPVDVVLVGAGVGSANILCQLKELNTLCIDAGIIIETFVDPKIKKDRIFLMPTNDF